jgi:hypothetical protein
VDVIEAFAKLLQHSVDWCGESSPEGADMKDESKFNDPDVVKSAIEDKNAAVIKACVAQLKMKTKNEKAKTQIMSLLNVMCASPSGIGDEKQFSSLFATMGTQFGVATSKSLKLDTLQFIGACIASPNHSVAVLRPPVLSILPLVCKAVGEDWCVRERSERKKS